MASKLVINKLAKKSVVLDYSLMKDLKLTFKEFAVLEQLAYNTSKTGVFCFPKIWLVEMCGISRAHLYRCLHSLKEKGLIYEDESGLYIAETYKKHKTKAFKNSHNIIDNEKIEEKTKPSFICDKTTRFDNEMSYFEKPLYTLKENTEILSERVNNTLSEKIYSLHSQSVKKSERDKLSLFLTVINPILKESVTKIDSYIFKDKDAALIAIKLLQPYVKDSKEIRNTESFQVIRSKIGSELGIETLEMLDKYYDKLSRTGFFCLKENEIAFQSQIKRLYDKGNLKVALLKNNSYVWLETSLNSKNKDNQDKQIENEGLICLKRLWQVIEKELKLQALKENNPKGFKWHIFWSYIYETCQKYKAKIKEFIDFRNAKKRFWTNSSLQALYLQIARFESKGINVKEAINQSIQRDYNWIFPITHKKRFFKKQASLNT